MLALQWPLELVHVGVESRWAWQASALGAAGQATQSPSGAVLADDAAPHATLFSLRTRETLQLKWAPSVEASFLECVLGS